VAPATSATDQVDDHVTVVNNGPGDATDVVLHDVVPVDAVIQSATIDNGSCTVDATVVTCVVPKLDAGGTAEADVIFSEMPGEAATGSLAEAAVVAPQFDPNPANDSNLARGPTPPPGAGGPMTDLVVHDHESASAVPLGGDVTETITVANDGRGTDTAVDVTDGLTAAVQLIRLDAEGAKCTSTLPLHCTFRSLPAGATRTIKLVVRALRAGPLTDAATVSADQAEPIHAHDVSAVKARVVQRRTAAQVRVVPVEPVTKAGSVAEFVITAALTTREPGVMPSVCVTLPPGLQFVAAPGATVDGSRMCWHSTDLTAGQQQSFRLRARVGRIPPGGARIGLTASLTGANFAARDAATSIIVPPQHVGCASRATPNPTATIAC
jgi:uncharacterized repeat protein (TIGR01451 family)